MARSSVYNPLTLTQADWQRFLSAEGLSEKAGVPADLFPFMVLKELADNAADNGGGSMTRISDDEVTITDEGPGLDPADVVRLYSVQRDLTSSKHWRRGNRGALGNGLRAVMGGLHVMGGTLTVASRGIATTVSAGDDGATCALATVPVALAPGTTITVRAPGIGRRSIVSKAALALTSLAGNVISGRPPPSWFDEAAIKALLRSATGVSVRDFVGQFSTGYRPLDGAADASTADPAALLQAMLSEAKREPKLNAVGADAFPGFYARQDGTFEIGAARLPYIVEVWATAKPATDEQNISTTLIVNRTVSLHPVTVDVASKGRVRFSDGSTVFQLSKQSRDRLTLKQSADFAFHVSITAPAVPIISSGKRPDLDHFAADILLSVAKAGRKAQDAVKKSRASSTVADVVARLLPEAYEMVSDGGRYWANVRQLMYAMRPRILEETGKQTVNDGYITGNLIPAFVLENPALTDGWKIAYDARGTFLEPHSRRSVALGTVSVGGYQKSRFSIASVVPSGVILQAPPEHRLAGILFVEKEGFAQNIEESGLLEKHDIALASTKGMSTVAIRSLIDHLAGHIPGLTLFTLTDFDIAGVTIEDTLVSSGWRYEYRNAVRHVPLAVNWPQARRLHAAGMSEPSGRENAASFAETLSRKGLEDSAVEFLTRAGDGGNGLRVELNAILPKDLLDIIGDGLARHAGRKVVPDSLDSYYAELLIRRRLSEHEKALRAASPVTAPPGLKEALAAALAREPGLSWDEALAQIIEARGNG